LRKAYESGLGISFVGHQLDVFLFESSSDAYLGRLCSFSRCPKEIASFPVAVRFHLTKSSPASRRVPISWRRLSMG
jgi:hypothetical protein